MIVTAIDQAKSSWISDILTIPLSGVNKDGVYNSLLKAAHALDFEYLAIGVKATASLDKTGVRFYNNYPQDWLYHYEELDFMRRDPVVQRGLQSCAPFSWKDLKTAKYRDFWCESAAFGISCGWSHSHIGSKYDRSMISIARNGAEVEKRELKEKKHFLLWLSQISQTAFVEAFHLGTEEEISGFLTDREVEVLSWTVEGKTNQEVAEILKISVQVRSLQVSL